MTEIKIYTSLGVVTAKPMSLVDIKESIQSENNRTDGHYADLSAIDPEILQPDPEN